MNPSSHWLETVTAMSDFVWGDTWNGEILLPFPPMVLGLL